MKVRPIRLVTSGGNKYLALRAPLGTKLFYAVYDWGQPELSMHLYASEFEREHHSRYLWPSRGEMVAIFKGTIRWKRRPTEREWDGPLYAQSEIVV